MKKICLFCGMLGLVSNIWGMEGNAQNEMMGADAGKMTDADVSKTEPTNVDDDLLCAAKQGNLGEVQRLVETCHADVETKDDRGDTPLNNAVGNDRFEIVKYLVETCHAKITDETVNKARVDRTREYLQSKLDEQNKK